MPKPKTKSGIKKTHTKSTAYEFTPRRIIGWLFVLIALTVGIYSSVNGSQAASNIKVYISNNGNDAWDGSQAKPFRTLNKAFVAVSGNEVGESDILILGPTYTVLPSDAILQQHVLAKTNVVLEPASTNSSGAPTVIQASSSATSGAKLQFKIDGMLTLSQLDLAVSITTAAFEASLTTAKVKLANNVFHMQPSSGTQKLSFYIPGSVYMTGNKFYFMDYLAQVGRYEGVYAGGGGRYYISTNGFMFPPNFKSPNSKGVLTGMQLPPNGPGSYYQMYSVVQNVITNAPGGGGQLDSKDKQIGITAAKRDTGDLEKDNAFPGFQGTKVVWVGSK